MDAATALRRAHALAFDGHMAAAADLLDRALARADGWDDAGWGDNGWNEARRAEASGLLVSLRAGAQDLHDSSQAAIAARRMEGAHA